MSNSGWICPRCKKVHAPFVPSCSCHPPALEGIGTKLPHLITEVKNNFICPDCGATGAHYCTGIGAKSKDSYWEER